MITKYLKGDLFMGYLMQLMIISIITLIGEFLHNALPLPIPASIYGMVLLFICLLTGIIKEEQIQETADFLLLIMPVMFIGPSVGIMEDAGILMDTLIPFIFIIVLSTAIIMAITGIVTQKILHLKGSRSSCQH